MEKMKTIDNSNLLDTPLPSDIQLKNNVKAEVMHTEELKDMGVLIQWS